MKKKGERSFCRLLDREKNAETVRLKKKAIAIYNFLPLKRKTKVFVCLMVIYFLLFLAGF